MRLSISHATTYNYAYQVRGSIQYLRLTPQSSERQRVLDWRLELPGPAQEQRDPYGNILHVLSMEQPHQSILITAHGDVEIETWHECEQDSQAPQPFLRETRLTHADTALSQFALKVRVALVAQLLHQPHHRRRRHPRGPVPVVDRSRRAGVGRADVPAL